MKSKKLRFGFLLLVIFSILISGCSSKSDYSLDEMAGDMDTSPQEEEDFLETDDYEEPENYEPDKIITTVYIEMQTQDFLPTTNKLEALISKYKGYVESSNISYNDYIYSSGLKYSDYSIRIPRESLDEFIHEVIEIGNIISQNKNKEDISKLYRDTESRLRVLETKEERILALLEKADKMEDIIKLENQLSDLIYEKESYTQNLQNMDDQVNYSTLHLSLNEVEKLSSGANTKTSFIEKLKLAFSDSFYFFTRNIGDLIIGLVYGLPYILIISIIVYIIYRLVWRRKKSKESSNKD